MNGLLVENNPFFEKTGRKQNLWLFPCIIAAVLLGRIVAKAGLPVLILLVALPVAVGGVWLILNQPRAGLIALIFYAFLMPFLNRQLPNIQFGLLVDGLLVLTWLGILFYQSNRFRWRHLHNELVWFYILWFGLTVLELANPSRPHFQGWLQEMRSAVLYPMLTVPLIFFLFNRQRDLVFFLHFTIVLSVIGALYGMKQLHVGVNEAERAWLEGGAKVTHILFGKLRVFSYYTEAAQFGASQAQFAVMCIILAVGPYAKGKKIIYGIGGALLFYGMLISGTRGAMGGLLGGGFLFLVLSKQIRILIMGAIIGLSFIGILKYTMIGNQNDQIRRMRTSMDPNDASLQVRLMNQKRFAEALATQPFGAGVGTVGMWGVTFNRHIPTAMIPPDSMYVKQWVMYGIVGFIGWFGFMLFLVGRSVAMIWKTRDPVLRNQIMAVCCGVFGSLVCSYGNEVNNLPPSSFISYFSFALVWLSARWDKPLRKQTIAEEPTEPSVAL